MRTKSRFALPAFDRCRANLGKFASVRPGVGIVTLFDQLQVRRPAPTEQPGSPVRVFVGAYHPQPRARPPFELDTVVGLYRLAASSSSSIFVTIVSDDVSSVSDMCRHSSRRRNSSLCVFCNKASLMLLGAFPSNANLRYVPTTHGLLSMTNLDVEKRPKGPRPFFTALWAPDRRTARQ